MIVWVLVHLKFSASSSINKELFIFDIIVLVYHRYQFIHSDWLYILKCFTDIDMSPELRTVSDPCFPKGQINITQELGFDEMAMT